MPPITRAQVELAARLDRVIRAAFDSVNPSIETNDTYFETGGCKTWGLGFQKFLRENFPELKVVPSVLVQRPPNEEPIFLHYLVEIPELRQSFDWRGAGAEERWPVETECSWEQLRDHRSRVAGSEPSYPPYVREVARRLARSLAQID